MRLRVGHQQWQFWPILGRFMDYYSLFWGPDVVSMVNEPCGAFMCRSSTLTVMPILARFFDYYSSFSGNEAISIIVEPQGPLTCRSSTLAVLANCGPFHGLLLIVLGSSSGFHG